MFTVDVKQQYNNITTFHKTYGILLSLHDMDLLYCVMIRPLSVNQPNLVAESFSFHQTVWILSPFDADNILSNNRNLTVVNLSVFLEHQQF